MYLTKDLLDSLQRTHPSYDAAKAGSEPWKTKRSHQYTNTFFQMCFAQLSEF